MGVATCKGMISFESYPLGTTHEAPYAYSKDVLAYQALATGSKANRYTPSPIDNQTRLNLREDKPSTFRELEIKAALFQREEPLF